MLNCVMNAPTSVVTEMLDISCRHLTDPKLMNLAVYTDLLPTSQHDTTCRSKCNDDDDVGCNVRY